MFRLRPRVGAAAPHGAIIALAVLMVLLAGCGQQRIPENDMQGCIASKFMADVVEADGSPETFISYWMVTLEVLTMDSSDEASPADDRCGKGHEGLVDVVADLPADAQTAEPV
ncbi:hypothetical protein HII36_09900, partial [Nonomuraea sp. NN258]|uniref:hypothetical protein n=1 Tax=Nonomuraea antri TaxID=2730852 RepID=UPI00156932E3|nr:hypothetical protein [Nonomuraea antri]